MAGGREHGVLVVGVQFPAARRFMNRVNIKLNSELEKFQGKFRIESNRLKCFDYSSSGAYFVTICTKGLNHYFCKIVNGEVKETDIGIVVEKCWSQIPEHFPFVELDEFVVMPNHVHGILFFRRDAKSCVSTDNDMFMEKDAKSCVSTPNDLSIGKDAKYCVSTENVNIFGPQSNNLASVIRGFKIGVTKYVRQVMSIHDIWQPRFYDRVIRKEEELNKIRQYIINNPLRWEIDKNKNENIFM